MIYHIDPALTESVVFHFMHKHHDAQAFHAEREKIYTIENLEMRDQAFGAFYGRWFRALSLDQPILDTLNELPIIHSSVCQCIVAVALKRKEEGAELYVAPLTDDLSEKERRHLRIQIAPETFLDRPKLCRLLRKELLHIADMLDPAFGYEPQLPSSPAGQTFDRLILDRYSALWNASVVGRLLHQGYLETQERASALDRFISVFPMFAADPEPIFSRFFHEKRPTHKELFDFAQNPRSLSCDSNGSDPGARCFVCKLPSYTFVSPSDLEPEVISRITERSPDWKPELGICAHCVEIYRTR